MNDKGFTIIEVLFALVWTAMMAGGLYLGCLVIMALRKYVGA